LFDLVPFRRSLEILLSPLVFLSRKIWWPYFRFCCPCQVLLISRFWQGDSTPCSCSLLPAAFEFQSPGPDFLNRSLPLRSFPSFSRSYPFFVVGCHVLASVLVPGSVLPLVTLPPRQFCCPTPSVVSRFSGAALRLPLPRLTRSVFTFRSTIW
jgi:hypothetical protein